MLILVGVGSFMMHFVKPLIIPHANFFKKKMLKKATSDLKLVIIFLYYIITTALHCIFEIILKNVMCKEIGRFH